MYPDRRRETYNQSAENVEVMQFTGLKDRNGKEIYEGDIVSYKSSKHDGEDYVTFNGVIEWWSGQTHVGWRYRSGKHTHVLKRGQLYSTEVIGNIYENKDLLNG